MSDRYIGREYDSMDTGPADNTVTLRSDTWNTTGGLMVAPLSISSPEGAVGSDRETVPNPVISDRWLSSPIGPDTSMRTSTAEAFGSPQGPFSRSVHPDQRWEPSTNSR